MEPVAGRRVALGIRRGCGRSPLPRGVAPSGPARGPILDVRPVRARGLGIHRHRGQDGPGGRGRSDDGATKDHRCPRPSRRRSIGSLWSSRRGSEGILRARPRPPPLRSPRVPHPRRDPPPSRSTRTSTPSTCRRRRPCGIPRCSSEPSAGPGSPSTATRRTWAITAGTSTRSTSRAVGSRGAPVSGERSRTRSPSPTARSSRPSKVAAHPRRTWSP